MAMRGSSDEVLLVPITDGTNNSNVQYYATTVTAANTALPDGWSGKRVAIQAYTTDAWVLFSKGSSATAVDKSKTAADKALGFHLIIGIPYKFTIPTDAKFISVQADSSTGYVLMLALDQPGNL